MSTRRAGVESEDCDRRFEQALRKMEGVRTDMRSACTGCIRAAARDLLAAGRLFVKHEVGSRRYKKLVEGLRESLPTSDVIGIASSLRDFEHTVDRSDPNWHAHDDPETHLALAVMMLLEAIENWSSPKIEDLREAVADTVRSRSHSGKILAIAG